MIYSSPFPTHVAKGHVHFRILQTSDLHAHIRPFDYYSDQGAEGFGLARTATLINQLRAECGNCLLLDNGDLLQGSALGDYIAYDRGLSDGELHPVIAAMNALAYDAATLGNHDFNFGLPFLMAALSRSKFPFVSANTLLARGANPRADTRLVPPYVLLDRKVRDGDGRLLPLRVGVIGVLPPQIAIWDETMLRGKIVSRDMVETVAALIPEMKEAGADIIVALAHTGIGGEAHVDGMENAALPLARLRGLDALITGHTHMVFPSAQFTQSKAIDVARGRLSGTPAVMAGFWGSHLGVIDLLLHRDGMGWQVLDSRSEARPIALCDAQGARTPLVKTDARVLRATKRAHEATLDYMRSPVGRISRPVHSYFSMLGDCRAVQLVCRAQWDFIRQKLAATPHASLPLLSASSPFKAGGRAGPENYTEIPAGEVFQRSIADLYCFPNTICALRLSGADIREWLERSAAAFHQITPGQQDQILVNADFPSYSFDVITELTYEIDVSQPARYSAEGEMVDPAAWRVRNLRYRGKTIDPSAEFIVATNNYRVSTISAQSRSAQIAFQAPTTIRTILFNYFSAVGDVVPSRVPNWHLADLPETSYIIETSARAVGYLGDAPLPGMEFVGLAPRGFAQFRAQGGKAPQHTESPDGKVRAFRRL